MQGSYHPFYNIALLSREDKNVLWGVITYNNKRLTMSFNTRMSSNHCNSIKK
jgi:hypothetical protein